MDGHRSETVCRLQQLHGRCRAENGTAASILYHRVENMSRENTRPRACIPSIPACTARTACLEVCPTGATYRREEALCLSTTTSAWCRYCVLACPYEARHALRRINNYYGPAGRTPYEMLRQKDLDKVTLLSAISALTDWRRVACPRALKRAFQRGTLVTSMTPKVKFRCLIAVHRGTVLREELGTKPSVYYING